jgi:hypothetical protein
VARHAVYRILYSDSIKIFLAGSPRETDPIDSKFVGITRNADIMTTLSSYLSITSNMSRWLTATAQSPAVSVATKYFEDNIGKVKSANDLVSNPRLFDYAMTAFGLGDMTYAQGLMKQVLAQGVSSSNALANTLPNPNIQAFARAFDFVDNGSSTTDPAVVGGKCNKPLP